MDRYRYNPSPSTNILFSTFSLIQFCICFKYIKESVLVNFSSFDRNPNFNFILYKFYSFILWDCFNFYIYRFVCYFFIFIFISCSSRMRSFEKYLYVFRVVRHWEVVVFKSSIKGIFYSCFVFDLLCFAYSIYQVWQVSFLSSKSPNACPNSLPNLFLLATSWPTSPQSISLSSTNPNSFLPEQENRILLISGTCTSYSTNCAQPLSSIFLTLDSSLFKYIFSYYLLQPSCFRYCLKREFLCCFSFYLFWSYSQYRLFYYWVMDFRWRICFRLFQKIFNTLQGSLRFQPYYDLVNEISTFWIPICIYSIFFLNIIIKLLSIPYIFFSGSGIWFSDIE